MTKKIDTVGLLAAGSFIVIWSTGFIGARATMPYAEPFWLLSMRFAATLCVLIPVVIVLKKTWPAFGMPWVHLGVASILMHSGYLGGVFAAIDLGLQANATSIIVSVQPILTALMAVVFLKERISPRKWLGLFLGLCGVLLTVYGKLSAGLGTPTSIALAVLALFSISLGTLYQKKFCNNLPILSGLVVQYLVSGLLCVSLSARFETQQVVWSTEFILGLAWLVVVLSCVAISLLYFLIKRGAATNVASLFFLVPGFTALFAWLLYKEPLGLAAFGGLGLVMLAVLLVNWPSKKPAI